jgi:2-dehydro-3-deoxygluconokinase
MYDLVTIGNVRADLYISASSLTTLKNRFYLAVGGKYFTNNIKIFIGGGAANVAIGVKKNRSKTAICSIIGNDEFRKTILHKLKLKGVSTRLTLFSQNYKNISVILLKEDGTRTTISYESPKENFFIHERLLKKISKAKAVYLGNLPDVSINHRAEVLKELKKQNVVTFLNIGSVDCEKGIKVLKKLFENTDVLIMNRYEFSEIIKTKASGLRLNSYMIDRIPSLKNKLLVITDAEKGSYAYFNNQVYYQKAIRPKKILDTTGAGDGYTAGFISEYLKHEDIKLSMRRGARYAAKILGKIGAN